jgi:hypothetical protein
VDAVWILDGKVHSESDTMVFLRGVKDNWSDRYELYYQEMIELEKVIKYFHGGDSGNYQEIYHSDLKKANDRMRASERDIEPPMPFEEALGINCKDDEGPWTQFDNTGFVRVKHNAFMQNWTNGKPKKNMSLKCCCGGDTQFKSRLDFSNASSILDPDAPADQKTQENGHRDDCCMSNTFKKCASGKHDRKDKK